MGVNTNTVIVRPASLDAGPEALLTDLGYIKFRRISDTSFSSAGEGSVWIGSVGDCILLYAADATAFFDHHLETVDKESQFFKNAMLFRDSLLRRFSQVDVAALTLGSVIGEWGFAVFQGGTLVRRQGGYDGMTLVDEGARLPEEEAYLSKFERIEDGGEVRYRDPAHPEDGEMDNSDFGQSLVFEICQSFTGFSLYAKELLDVRGTNFWLNDDEEFHSRRVQATPLPKHPWWKLWG